MSDFVYCPNPDCRNAWELRGSVVIRCQDCGYFVTNVKPDWDQPLPEPATLAVIACSKQKSDAPGEIPAHRRYTGALFQAQLAYARTVLGLADDDIYVASAKLGLIGINDPIPDYNLALHQLRAGERWMWGWRVALGLRSRNPQRIYLLAGMVYRAAITEFMPDVDCLTPTGGLGLGYAKQVQWYKQQVSDV